MIKPDYDGYLSVSDTQLYYRLYGKGHSHTLLFLHGNGVLKTRSSLFPRITRLFFWTAAGTANPVTEKGR